MRWKMKEAGGVRGRDLKSYEGGGGEEESNWQFLNSWEKKHLQH